MWNAVTQKMRDLLFVALNSIKLTWQCSKIIIFHRKNTSNQWPSDHAGTMTQTSFTDIGPIESCPCPGSIDSLEMKWRFLGAGLLPSCWWPKKGQSWIWNTTISRVFWGYDDVIYSCWIPICGAGPTQFVSSDIVAHTRLLHHGCVPGLLKVKVNIPFQHAWKLCQKHD